MRSQKDVQIDVAVSPCLGPIFDGRLKVRLADWLVPMTANERSALCPLMAEMDFPGFSGQRAAP